MPLATQHPCSAKVVAADPGEVCIQNKSGLAPDVEESSRMPIIQAREKIHDHTKEGDWAITVRKSPVKKSGSVNCLAGRECRTKKKKLANGPWVCLITPIPKAGSPRRKTVGQQTRSHEARGGNGLLLDSGAIVGLY